MKCKIFGSIQKRIRSVLYSKFLMLNSALGKVKKEISHIDHPSLIHGTATISFRRFEWHFSSISTLTVYVTKMTRNFRVSVSIKDTHRLIIVDITQTIKKWVFLKNSCWTQIGNSSYNIYYTPKGEKTSKRVYLQLNSSAHSLSVSTRMNAPHQISALTNTSCWKSYAMYTPT